MSTPTDIAGKALTVGAAFAVLATATVAGLVFGRRVMFAIVGTAAMGFVMRGAYLQWIERE